MKYKHIWNGLCSNDNKLSHVVYVVCTGIWSSQGSEIHLYLFIRSKSLIMLRRKLSVHLSVCPLANSCDPPTVFIGWSWNLLGLSPMLCSCAWRRDLCFVLSLQSYAPFSNICLPMFLFSLFGGQHFLQACNAPYFSVKYQIIFRLLMTHLMFSQVEISILVNMG